jgi:hypothetical protein
MKTINRGDKNFEEVLAEIKERFHQKGGNEDSETVLNWNKQDYKEGFVSIWTDNKDAALLIKRSSTYIRSIKDHGDSVEIVVDKIGFRSSVNAFKVSK